MMLIRTKSKPSTKTPRRPVQIQTRPKASRARTAFPADAWNAWHERQTI